MTAGSSDSSQRPSLLFITPWVPMPSASGGQIVSAGLLRLYAAEMDVDVIYGRAPGGALDWCPPSGVNAIAAVPMRLQYGANRIYSLAVALSRWIRGRSMRAGKMATPNMRRTVSKALSRRRYDYVHADLTLLSEAVPFGKRLIVSAQNIEVEVMERLAKTSTSPLRRVGARLESLTTSRDEGAAMRRASAVIAMSDRDADALAALYQIERAKIVAVYPFVPAPVGPPALPSGRNLLLLGNLSAPPRAEGTLWFLDHVWPVVAKAVPDVAVDIVGASPPSAIRRRESDRVRVHGFLENTEAVRAQARAIVVPLLAGGGIRVKVIEAMGWGLPVVSTTIGATGLRADTYSHIALADGPKVMAECIIRLLTDDTWCHELVRGGAEHVSQFYTEGMAREAIRQVIRIAEAHNRAPEAI